MAELWLIRHGATLWSKSGQHTGRTDIPLTPDGEEEASRIGQYLGGRSFALVLVSPLIRARETCRIAGYANAAQIEPDLREWDYGAYEGRTTGEIRQDRPEWSLWQHGVPEGETIEQVATRAQRVIARAQAADGDVALFGHGHILRIVTACWLELLPSAGRLFALATASISILGYERETRVIDRWNRDAGGS